MMKKNVFLKSTLRQPIRNLFLVLLVGVISFAFSSRTGEYMLIEQEVAQIGSYYRSLGRLEQLENHNGDQDEAIQYLKRDPRVATVNEIGYFSGMLPDGIFNMDSNIGCNYGPSGNCHDMFFYGKLIEKAGPDKKQKSGRDHDWYYYTVLVDKVVAGYPEYLSAGMTLELTAATDEEGDAETLATLHSQLEEGKRYLIRAHYDITDYRCINQEPSRLLVKSLSATETNIKTSDYSAYSSVHLYTERYFMRAGDTWFLEAPTDLDLTRTEYAPIYEDLQKVMANQRAVGIAGLTDVSAYTKVQEESRLFNLIEGRWPSERDTAQNARVCAIPQELAQIRGIQLGDSIDITLRDLPAAVDGHTGDGVSDRFRIIVRDSIPSAISILHGNGYSHTGEQITVRYEVVGLYTCTRSDTIRILFVPSSTIPSHWVRPWETDSFILTSPQAEDEFLEETRYDLRAMGYRTVFYPNNSAGFYATADSVKGSARNNTFIFAVILFVCLGFSGFIYFRFRRRDLAISWALGVPVGQCVRGVSLPFVVIGAVGAAAGTAAAWKYVGSHTETLLSAFAEFARGNETVALTPSGAIAVWLGICILLGMITLAFSTVAARRPPLLLLHGNSGKVVRQAPPWRVPPLSPPRQVCPPPSPPQCRREHRRIRRSERPWAGAPCCAI